MNKITYGIAASLVSGNYRTMSMAECWPCYNTASSFAVRAGITCVPVGQGSYHPCFKPHADDPSPPPHNPTRHIEFRLVPA